MPRHVRKGDTVMVTSGSYKGQTGQILRVIPDHDRVVVKGINLRTKHLKPSRINPQGGVITREEPLHISKVSPIVDGQAVTLLPLNENRKNISLWLCVVVARTFLCVICSKNFFVPLSLCGKYFYSL